MISASLRAIKTISIHDKETCRISNIMIYYSERADLTKGVTYFHVENNEERLYMTVLSQFCLLNS